MSILLGLRLKVRLVGIRTVDWRIELRKDETAGSGLCNERNMSVKARQYDYECEWVGHTAHHHTPPIIGS